MFSFFRKSRVDFGAKKALEESGMQSSSYTEYLRFIKGLGFIDALDASRDTLPQSMQSICFAFATLDLMRLRCKLHGQRSNVIVIEESMEYLGKALELQISVSANPEHSSRTADTLLGAVHQDAMNLIKENATNSAL